MWHGCRRGGNLRRVERQRGSRTRPEKLRLRRPTRGETWRTQTWYRLQHAGSRERRKPSRWWKTTRTERDRRSGIRRPKEGDLREWTFTGTSGDGPPTRDEVPGEAGSRARQRARDPARLGGNAEGEAEVGRRRDRDSRGSRRAPEASETVKLPPVTANSKTGASERPTTDGCCGTGGRPRDLEHQPTPRVAHLERGDNRALHTPL